MENSGQTQALLGGGTTGLADNDLRGVAGDRLWGYSLRR